MPAEDTTTEVSSKKQTPNSNSVIVVGDWVVDEHWVVGDHRSPSSSRTGQRHSRALHTSSCSVRSLCGAGQVATILHEAKLEGEDSRIQVIGIGLWHKNDGELVRDMLNPMNNKNRTPYHLSSAIGSTPPSAEGARMISLAPQELSVGTTRVIRIYRRRGDLLDLIHRVDWELPLDDKKKAIENNSKRVVENEVKTAAQNVSHIVVKDLRKGVVSSQLIRELASQFKDAAWYISSKAWRPEWYDELPKEKVQLLFVPQLAAWMAMRDDPSGFSSWITAGGQPSVGALKAVQDLAEEFNNAKIVVLPKELSVLARECGAQEDLKGYIQSDLQPFSSDLNVPMASVFFPALIAHEIQNPLLSCFEQLKNSLCFAKSWMGHEEQRLRMEDWVPSEEKQHLKVPYKGSSFGSWREFDWRDEKELWDSALTDLGILTEGNIKVFHLWRAMTDIDGYVSCLTFKRKILQTLLEQCSSFGPRDRRRHKSFLIIDRPGSGKSFLVSRLARSLSMRYLAFNITQMLTRHDLHHCFDTIVTSQSQDPDQPTLVFVDEINAKLDSQHVYDTFLGPLEQGLYQRSGNKFHIQPCIWIFAGTELPSEDGGGKSDKGSDFVSRLSLAPLNLMRTGSSAKEMALMEIEQVYIGVAAIRNTFLDVSFISEKVLFSFSILPHEIGPRGISSFVKSFDFIQYGRVESSHLPHDWCSGMGVARDKLAEWANRPEGPFVSVVSDPRKHEDN